MPRNETTVSQLGLVNGLRQPQSDMVLVAEPAALFSPEARKGSLYIVVETDHDIARGRDACQLVVRTIRKTFFDDSSYSVTSALRKAIIAANKALYQHNFGAPAQKRAMVGISCAIIKDSDLYLAQVAPTQVFLLAEGRLRALPGAVWATGQSAASGFLKPRALGTSLTIEPDFYRAVLRPGDVALLCSSNLGTALEREAVLQLLRLPDPAAIADQLFAYCRQSGMADAHALALTVRPPLSPAAQAAPFSRAGVSERGRVLLRTAGAKIARFTGEAALLVKGPGERERRSKAERRTEQARREDERMTVVPPENYASPDPPPNPRPLDLGETLEEAAATQATARRSQIGALPVRPRDGVPPPSTYLGEGGYYPPVGQRRVDLSDTPGMGANSNGRRTTGAGMPSLVPTLGERLLQPFEAVAGWFSAGARRRKAQRPPPGALPQVRKQQGLSYRRQGPPFPWLLLLLLISLVALLVVYGRSLAVDNAQKQATDDLLQAELAVAAVRDAPDENQARQRLDVAAEALAIVRATGVVTASLDNRQRFEALEREYERSLAAIQRLTYFSDLTEIGSHPQAAAGATFNSIIIPPPPGAITNTAGFSSIYALDTQQGTLYRMPRGGGTFTPFLKPTDSFASGVLVGNVRAAAWRIDNIVAVAQSDVGPFIYYFRNNEQWNFSNMGGSEEWGRNVGKQFRLITYDGNLYIWGAATGQVLKYSSGRPGDLYEPWIKDPNTKIDSAVDLQIDGSVYLLQPDGRVSVFARNMLEREIAAPKVDPELVTPTGFFVTGPPESGFIFLLDNLKGRVIQIDKMTGTLIQQVSARPDSAIRLDRLTAVHVDDSGPRPVLYLVNGGQILRASLPDRPRPFREAAPTSGPTTAPTAGPTPIP